MIRAAIGWMKVRSLQLFRSQIMLKHWSAVLQTTKHPKSEFEYNESGMLKRWVWQQDDILPVEGHCADRQDNRTLRVGGREYAVCSALDTG